MPTCNDEADTFIYSELNVVANSVSQHRVGVSDPESSDEKEKELIAEVVKASSQDDAHAAIREASAPIHGQEKDSWGSGPDSPQL